MGVLGGVPVIEQQLAAAFLDERRIAVVGVSTDPKKFGNVIYRTLRDHGKQVVPVHPAAPAIEGDLPYPDLASVPDEVDAVLVMVPGAAAADVVRAAAARGIEHVWLFRGVGSAGALTDEALAVCEETCVQVVAGACPLMFLEPVRGAHRLHRGVRRLRHAVA